MKDAVPRQAHGDPVIGMADVSVTLGGRAIIESLNLGTSSGIVLYEIGKQRRAFQARLSAKIAAKKRAAGEA